MYETQLFNLLTKYNDNADYNPVANLALHHNLALKMDDAAQMQLNYLMELLLSTDIKCYTDNDRVLHISAGKQDITLTYNNILHINGVNLPCKVESCCDLMSIVSSGEVVAVLPLSARKCYNDMLNAS